MARATREILPPLAHKSALQSMDRAVFIKALPKSLLMSVSPPCWWDFTSVPHGVWPGFVRRTPGPHKPPSKARLPISQGQTFWLDRSVFWYFSVALLQKHSAQKVSVHLPYENTLKFKNTHTHKKNWSSELHGGNINRQPHHKLISDIERINPTGKRTVGSDRKAPICHTGPL